MYSQLRRTGCPPLQAVGHIATGLALLGLGLVCAGADLLGGWERVGRLLTGAG